MKIGILGYYGYNNYGDDLMLYSIIKQLENCNNCEVVVFCKKSGLKFLDDYEGIPFLLILDQVQDPRNLGACLRSADAAGVTMVITWANIMVSGKNGHSLNRVQELP